MALSAPMNIELVLRIAVAAVLGGAIGLERELTGKPAGLRTNMLICMGSAMLMDLSMNLSVGANGVPTGDPGRIAAQIVTGIGFLGAGSIVQQRGTVVGLTTAATIWVVAAIGMLAGAGWYVEAAGSTAFVLVVLVGLGRVERRILTRHRSAAATIEVRPGADLEEIRATLREIGLRVVSSTLHEGGPNTTFDVRLAGPVRLFDAATARLLERDDVLSVQFE